MIGPDAQTARGGDAGEPVSPRLTRTCNISRALCQCGQEAPAVSRLDTAIYFNGPWA